MSQKDKDHKGERILRYVPLAALIACLLATTVLAAPILWKIFGEVTDSQEAYIPTEERGSGQKGISYEIAIDLELNEGAPDSIETFYMPQLPETYNQSFGYTYSGMDHAERGAVVYAWDVPDSEKMGVMFYQLSQETFESDDSTLLVFAQTGREPEMRQVALGGKEGLLILAPDETEWGRKYFYWSDGDYVFYMRFTYDFTQAQMDEMVASVRLVEDIRPYMVSMTDEELKTEFDES